MDPREHSATHEGCNTCTQAAEGDAKRPLEGGVDAPAAKKPETASAQAGQGEDKTEKAESEAESGSDEESDSEDESDDDSDEVQQVHIATCGCD